WLHHEQGDDELAEHFILRAEQLRSAIDDHPESHAIWLALD
ncbi:antirestriction protein, partial [Salmonella enterica subsp. enterica serovar Enteritidis]|nr:antirestriction protein [Salmonella enterica subsp. enterica serovar Enteritidis]